MSPTHITKLKKLENFIHSDFISNCISHLDKESVVPQWKFCLNINCFLDVLLKSFNVQFPQPLCEGLRTSEHSEFRVICFLWPWKKKGATHTKLLSYSFFSSCSPSKQSIVKLKHFSYCNFFLKILVPTLKFCLHSQIQNPVPKICSKTHSRPNPWERKLQAPLVSLQNESKYFKKQQKCEIPWWSVFEVSWPRL